MRMLWWCGCCGGVVLVLCIRRFVSSTGRLLSSAQRWVSSWGCQGTLAPHPTRATSHSRHFPTRIWPQCLCVVAFCIAMTAHCPILPVEAVLIFAALCKVASGTAPVAECVQGGLQAGVPLHSGLSLWKRRGGRHCRAHKRHAGTSQQLINIIANGPPTCSTPATGLASSHTASDAEAMHVPSLLYSPTAKLPTPTPIILLSPQQESITEYLEPEDDHHVALRPHQNK
jgi:hypothetical protein